MKMNKLIAIVAVAAILLMGCNESVDLNINTLVAKEEKNDNISEISFSYKEQKVNCFVKNNKIYKCAEVWKWGELSEEEQNVLFH